ncbi:MAG: OadG family protein [Dehalococcoidia bacterium]
MSDGLLLSVIGIAAVFVTLTVLMLFVMGMERVLRGRGVAVEGMAAEGAAVATGEVGAVAEMAAEPGDTVEVAAVALALASYMRGQGKQFGAGPLAVGGAQYQVEVGDLSRSPVVVVVNGQSYWASMDGEGLPVAAQIAPVLRARTGETQRGRGWRSAYPPAQGGHWDRRGWSGGL